MSRYDLMWQTLVDRAIAQSVTDLDTFLNMAYNAGFSAEVIERKLLDDLQNEGPIFGKFLRSLTGASESAISAAFNSGVMAGDLVSNNEMLRLIEAGGYSAEEMGLAIENADAEAMDAMIAEAEKNDYRTWIATLERTCDRCLPLHGHTETMEYWKSKGYLPELMHDGWKSDCKCRLVPSQQFDSEAKRRVDYVKPLVRTKLTTTTGLKTSKKTQRTVMQADLERALAARDKALQSEIGRRTLRQMGQMGDEGKGNGNT